MDSKEESIIADAIIITIIFVHTFFILVKEKHIEGIECYHETKETT